MSQLDPILTAGRGSSSIQVLYRASSIVCPRKILRDQNIAHHKLWKIVPDYLLMNILVSTMLTIDVGDFISTVTSWVVFLQLTRPATETSSPPGCLTAPSWDSESLRGCGWHCNAPSPTTTQSGCTSHCLRPPSSGYICELKQSVKYFGLVLLMG